MTVCGDLVCDSVVITDAGLSYTGEGAAVWEYTDTSLPFLEETSPGEFRQRAPLTCEGSPFEPSPGMYTVVLNVDGNVLAGGTVIKDGILEKEYSWVCRCDDGNHAVEMDYTYRFSEFMEYYERAEPRTAMLISGDARFVVQDPATDRLVRGLEGAFLKEFGSGSDLHGQDYADFLLSFVQCCFAYPPMTSLTPEGYVLDEEGGSPDTTLRAVPEYWSYPMETIHLGAGDCEDTSILACTIFATAGYDSCIALTTDHMLAGLELTVFSERDTGYTNVTMACKRMDGHDVNIYFCETTYDIPVPVGYVSDLAYDDIMAITEVTPVPAFAEGSS